MALKTFTTTDNIKVNVMMKNGQEYLGCDASVEIQSGLAFSFWHENALRMVPLADVLYADFYEDNVEAGG